jgi:hypothetical protein
MSTAVELLASGKAPALPPTQPFDETAWQVWVTKGQKHDRRGSAARGKLVRWIPIAALIVTAALWSKIGPYETVVRFIVAGGATVVMCEALHEKHYTIAAVFAALALLYNPVVPVFSFAGLVWRALAISSIVPFAASLAWPDARKTTSERTRNI